eukprot:3776316-Rhodomonas_salina.1
MFSPALGVPRRQATKHGNGKYEHSTRTTSPWTPPPPHFCAWCCAAPPWLSSTLPKGGHRRKQARRHAFGPGHDGFSGSYSTCSDNSRNDARFP